MIQMQNKYSPSERAFLISIGQNIKNFRKKDHISQEELADLACIDRSYLGGVERGERNISAINLQKIANALHVDTRKLLTISKVKNP